MADAFVAGPEPSSATFCPSCGEVLPILEALRRELLDAQMLIDRQEDSLRECEAELRVKRSQISKLRGEQDKQLEASPFASEATEIFHYWRSTPAGEGAKAFNMDRFQGVVARLRDGHTIETIKRAIDGASANPRPGMKRTDLKTICRNEPNLLMFLDFADRAERKRPQPPQPAPPASTYADQTMQKHEEANRWRGYAERLNGAHPALAQKILDRACLLDTNATNDPANAELLTELHGLAQRQAHG